MQTFKENIHSPALTIETALNAHRRMMRHVQRHPPRQLLDLRKALFLPVADEYAFHQA